jgi:hypothetical protein
VQHFFSEFNNRLYDKNSESDFFFLHQNHNIFFSNIGNQNIFLEKNITSPPPLQVKWSLPKIFQGFYKFRCVIFELFSFVNYVAMFIFKGLHWSKYRRSVVRWIWVWILLYDNCRCLFIYGRFTCKHCYLIENICCLLLEI